MIDSHCHLQFNAYKEDREEVIKRCLERGVACNVVGTQKDTSRLAVELAEQYEGLYATIGLHPIHITSTEVDEEEIFFKSREEIFDEAYYGGLAKSKKVIAVGECGLELFHLPPDADKHKILEQQTKQFIAQADFAAKHNLPLVIHVRDAYDEMVEVLHSVIARTSPGRGRGNLPTISQQSHVGEIASLPMVARNDMVRGVMHCFSGNWTQASQFLDLGLYLGFTGVITFPAKKTALQAHFDLIEVVKNTPIDRILIETDAPYLAPQAYRGQRCEPWMVVETAKKIAEIKELSTEEVIQTVDKNAKMLFSI